MGLREGLARMEEMGNPVREGHRVDLVRMEPLEFPETGETLESLVTMECRDSLEIWDYPEKGENLACPEHPDDLVLMASTERRERAV